MRHQSLFRGMRRREFLAASASSLLVASRGWSSDVRVEKNPALGANPFTLGVASGDPTSSGLVIWTRLAPRPLEGGGMPASAVAVRWEVAEEDGFKRIVHQGETIAQPELAHSVHVEVEGLQPARWYFYRFAVGNEVSPVGRGRTMPADGTTPDRLRFAFASCQHWEAGHFTAYEHMAKSDLDLIFHLGDYIYEGPGRKGVRTHTGTSEIKSLLDYRNRHAQYKTDAFLQAVHAKCPWMVTWDDHEVDNNYANDISEEEKVDPRDFLKRRANAYQAYYEHMPLRHDSIPSGPAMKLYRRVRFGNLAEFSVLDTRQYRSDQPNGDGLKPLGKTPIDPLATMLGADQENWLFEGLKQSACRWNVLAQQVMMAHVDFSPGSGEAFAMDQWPGYSVARRRVLDFIAKEKVSNPIVITGDIHSNWCNNLLVDFDQKEAEPVAVEFVGTSITSGGDGGKLKFPEKMILDQNPFVKFQNSKRDYVECTVTPSEWRSDYQMVDFVTKPGALLSTIASFVVENGVAGVKKA
jgi:alkaline phosphatase D